MRTYITDKSCHQILITSARNNTRLPTTRSNIEKKTSKRDHSEKVVARENENAKVKDKRIQVNDQSIEQVDTIIALKHNNSKLAVVKGNSNEKLLNVTRRKKINQPTRTSVNDNEIPLNVDNIHTCSPIIWRYSKSKRIQTDQPKPETVEFKHNQTESVVTRANTIAKEIDERVTNIDIVNRTVGDKGSEPITTTDDPIYDVKLSSSDFSIFLRNSKTKRSPSIKSSCNNMIDNHKQSVQVVEREDTNGVVINATVNSQISGEKVIDFPPALFSPLDSPLKTDHISIAL